MNEPVATHSIQGLNALEPIPGLDFQFDLKDGVLVPQGSGSVYLAGPITGLSYREARFGWRKYVADRLSPGIQALSPMRHEGHLSEVQGGLRDHYPDHFFSKSKVLFQKDMLDIKRADVVLVNFLDAVETAKGTLVEIGVAYAWDKFVVVVVSPGSLHDYPFVTEPASAVLHDLDEAITIINSLLSEGI